MNKPSFSTIKPVSRDQLKRLRRRLLKLYGNDAEKMLERFYMMIGRYGIGLETLPIRKRWNEKDAVLITYADMVQDNENNALSVLNQFCNRHLKGAVNTLHLLPFYPWSSDDGFSVIDYRQVATENGTWQDVQHIGKDFHLMFDFVLNHCSAKSRWFKDYVSGIEPEKNYFVEANPKEDLSLVTRPRASPLLTKTQTRAGTKYVWTTFSADQVDLNWKSPDLLFEFLDILFYYLSMGAKIFRLDAVAFMWKKIGTNCLHLPETHEIVKLFRDVLEIVSPESILITETNVPHEENISYFGRGDEAHMVYQFTLPPLLLHGLLNEKSNHLTEWALQLPKLRKGCTYLNFTASHDGVGVRPLQGILDNKEIKKLVRMMEARGGKVNWKSNSDGTKSPYELNITYYDAMSDLKDDTLGMRRFFCSQALALSMQGIPAVYFHSLIGTLNNYEGVKKTNENRTINRRKWNVTELNALIENPETHHSIVFQLYQKLLRKRTDQPAFDPDALQIIHDLGKNFFALTRESVDKSQKILCLYNFTSKTKSLKKPIFLKSAKKRFFDIASGKTIPFTARGLSFKPYHFYWLLIDESE